MDAEKEKISANSGQGNPEKEENPGHWGCESALVRGTNRFQNAMFLKCLLRISVIVTVLTAVVLPSGAQVLEETLFTAGTVTRNGANEDWAYLSFQIDDPGKLRARKLAVYAKPGQPGSGGAFVRRAVVTVQTDPLILQTLVNRAANLGESAVVLGKALDEVFGPLVPDPALSLPRKLSAVIQGAMADAKQYGSLVLLSRTHPAVALALGLAHAEPVGAGATTFEVREFDVGAGEDLGVMGRVTVTAGLPVVLPAPGRPVEVPDGSAKGHLNARLRWGTPVGLRRLSLLHFGYDVYRAPRAWAEGLNLQVTPPDASVLAAMAEQGLNGVKRINRAPALAARVMTEAEAVNLVLDPKTAFLNDDNGLSGEAPVPFKDGDQFYYFVAARDLLGRNGMLSPGTLVTMSDRVPPSAPRRVTVENDYRYEGAEGKQRLRVTWQQRPAESDNRVIGYYVYRWKSPGDVSVLGGNPTLNRVSPLVPHVPGEATATFLDETPDAPMAPESPDSFDKTVYYTVRAVEQVSAGENLSGHSAPAGGVLRDREAPEGPGGGVYVECCEPVALANGFADVRHAGFDRSEVVIDLVCSREASGIRFAEFYLNGTGATHLHARVHFAAGSNMVRKRLVLRRDGVAVPFTVHCRTGMDAGRVSGVATQTVTALPAVGERRRLLFRGTPRCTEVLWDEAAEEAGCPGHDPLPGLPGGEGAAGNAVHGLKIKMDLTPTSKEWRLYRRIDGGQMTLLRQGLADFDSVQQIEVTDKDLPSSAVTVFYYGQLLDQNGNASQLALLSKAVPVQAAPGMPMLAPVAMAGTPGNPAALVRWFCPVQGVERFEVLVHSEPGPVPAVLTPLLGENHHQPLDQFANGPVEAEETQTLSYGAYYTPQVGGAFGNGPDFQFTFPMVKDRSYLIQIAAVSKHGGKRTVGNVQRVEWQGAKGLTGVPVPGTPGVPWPELLPPEPGEGWHPGMVPEQLNGAWSGIGIRIGQLTPAQVYPNAGGVDVRSAGGLESALFPPMVPNASGDRLLPLVLYRYQVPSALYPTVSGDLIQVTPLMEKIALAERNGTGGVYMAVKDPFVRIFGQSFPEPTYYVYLLDTQPVVRRASYAYVAVRFGRDGEIASVHPLPAVTVN